MAKIFKKGIGRIRRISPIRLIRPIGLLCAAVLGCALLLAPSPARASALIKAPPNNLGLVGYWNLNEAAGTTAADSSGSGNTGTLTGSGGANNLPQHVGGKFSNGLNFDGTDDYVSIPDNAVLDVTAAVTVSTWVKTTATNDNKGIVAKDKSGGSNTYKFRTGTGASVGKMVFIVNPSGGQITLTSTNNFSDGNWHHWVGTYDGTNVRLYEDGALDQSGSSSGNITTDNTATLQIGEYNFSDSFYFSGLIDDVRIYNRALSAAEVATLYRATGGAKVNTLAKNAVSSNGLVGYWSADGVDVNGATAYDRSGSANNGTLTPGAGAHTTAASMITDGILGQAFSMDGTDDYVSINGSASLNVTSAITVSAWYNPSDITAYRAVVNRRAHMNDDVAFGLEVSNIGKPYFYIVSSGQVSGGGNVSATTLSNGTWYLLTGTYDGVNVKLYVNGVISVTDPVTTDIQVPSTAKIQIGGSSNSGFGQGLIDDVRIYNRALSAAEVQALYNFRPAKVNSLRNSSASNLQSGLVVWQPFDGAYLNTTTSTDVSGSANNGTLTNGPVPAIGKLGQALKFDGTDDYVQMSDNDSLKMTSAITAAVWVRPNTPGQNGYIYDKNNDVSLLYNSSNKFRFFTGFGGAGPDITTTNTYAAGAWYHVVATYNRVTAIMYVNGAQVDSQVNTTAIPTSATPARIGCYSNNGGACTGSSWGFTGSIDDLRIYNRALSAAEVLQLYNMGK